MLDPELINVGFYSDGASTFFHYVAAPAECNLTENAWYYDDPGDPTHVLLCPETCDSVQGRIAAELEIEFGCETQYAMPL
jgi:hypothetical protein